LASKWLNLFGPLNQTGYGYHFYNWARQVTFQLVTKGINVCVIPRGQISRPELQGEHITSLDGTLLDAISLQDEMRFDAPSVGLWHAHDMSQFCGDQRVGYTVWETTGLTNREIHHLHQMEYVAVPSTWHKKVLTEKFMPVFGQEWKEKCLVWPEGVDHTFFAPASGAMSPFIQDNCFTWVNVGKWEVRKGTAVLIKAFSDLAVEQGSPMRLIGLWGNPFIERDTWLREITRTLDAAGFSAPQAEMTQFGPRLKAESTISNGWVEIYDRFPTKIEVRELYHAADAGVFPYFAEGWGLPTIEMMAMGKPVAATGWGAPMEYLQAGTYWAITGEDALAYDGIWFRGNKGNWHQVSSTETHAAMRRIFTAAPEDRREVGMKAANHVRTNFSWQASATKAVNDIENLLEVSL
jgi:glycosyltransferase involved in cell wall biosynthesis